MSLFLPLEKQILDFQIKILTFQLSKFFWGISKQIFCSVVTPSTMTPPPLLAKRERPNFPPTSPEYTSIHKRIDNSNIYNYVLIL